MKKRKILTILTLLMWLTWIQVTQASNFVNNKLKDSNTIEFNSIEEEIKKISDNKDELDDENVNSINYLSDILDQSIKTKVFAYFKKEISLTKFKKELNNNIQKRRKIHKNLVSEYNDNLESDEYLTLITNNWLKINQLSEMKNIFFEKTEA